MDLPEAIVVERDVERIVRFVIGLAMVITVVAVMALIIGLIEEEIAFELAETSQEFNEQLPDQLDRVYYGWCIAAGISTAFLITQAMRPTPVQTIKSTKPIQKLTQKAGAR